MTGHNIEIRPITSQDILAFYGHGLRDTVRGWSVYLDGELAAICGITIGHGIMVAFSEVKPGLEVSKITIWRTANDLMGRIKTLGYKRFFAVANPSIPGAPAFLERLGFIQVESSARGEVFKWEIQ